RPGWWRCRPGPAPTPGCGSTSGTRRPAPGRAPRRSTGPARRPTARRPAAGRSRRARPGRSLAARAEVGRPVHPLHPGDRTATAPARLTLPAVDVQRALEVAALAVDIDV